MSGLNGDWYEALKGEFAKPYYRKLFATVNEEYKTRLIFPPAKDIFNAFHLTPLKDVKVVILGQDPYHIFQFDFCCVTDCFVFVSFIAIPRFLFLSTSIPTQQKKLPSKLWKLFQNNS